MAKQNLTDALLVVAAVSTNLARADWVGGFIAGVVACHILLRVMRVVVRI